MNDFIPVNEPLLNGNEWKYVKDCIDTGWISSAGNYIEEFESRWSSYCGMKYGIAVSNGTTALQVAIHCLNLKPGDEVILPTFTIISCALAVVEVGAVPVLVDSNPRTWCMDVSQVETLITPRTRAIMPVHIYGHPVDMDPLLRLAEKYSLAIIEDAAEVHGAEYLSKRNPEHPEWRLCGGMGHISTFSFYANKLITTGEGGMLLTNNPLFNDRARSLRNLGFRNDRRFFHTEIGFNYRLTNLQAALGVAQIERFDSIIEKKRWIGTAYTKQLQELNVLQLPVEEPWAHQVYWMYGLVLNESTGIDASHFAQRLRALGVDTRPFFLGMHEQPLFLEQGLFKDEHYPIAERIARQGLYLPSGLALSEEQLNHVCDAVKKVLQ
jgi:perosamine synthetase